MHTFVRSGLIFTLVVAGASGCSSFDTIYGTPSPYSEGAVKMIPPSSPSLPSPAGLDDYKTLVAQHVARHNSDRIYSGTLPPMLPAIVVLSITVDEDGQLRDVAVQRSRDPDASEVALAAMRRSTPLPRPQLLAQQAGGKLTFSETFLFADSGHYQLRSLAGPQASE
jgi:protein TonB